MSAPAIWHFYRYDFASRVDEAPGRHDLRLATSAPGGGEVAYFRGRLTRPLRAADLLRGVVDVVRSRFYIPPAMLARTLAMADPVVTCGDEMIRFEAFSSCCGVYARADFLPAAVEGDRVERGTTNVDFNEATRAALARVRDGDAFGMAIGPDAVELSRGGESVVERKVALPLRWLSGFVEVQAYQGRMVRRLEIPGPEALRFLRSLPRGAGPMSAWVVGSGRGLRLSRPHEGLSAWGVSRGSGSSRTSPGTPGASGFMPTSPRGPGLGARARRGPVPPRPESRRLAQDSRGRGRCSAHWRRGGGRRRCRASAPRCGGSRGLIPTRWRAGSPSIASGSTRHSRRSDRAGLVGFDLAEGAYFHRELPFDLGQVEQLHPRLKGARKLVADGAVRFTRRGEAGVEAYVRGTGVEHRVAIAGDDESCTCPWFAKHRGERGPCKHVLAVRILLDDEAVAGEDRP